MYIPASTINTWFESGCCLIEIVGEEQRKSVLFSTYLMVDETPIRVLDKQKKGKTHRGYFWVYYLPEQKLVWFDYQPGMCVFKDNQPKSCRQMIPIIVVAFLMRYACIIFLTNLVLWIEFKIKW